MTKIPHYHRTRWLYRLTFLCAVGGGAAYYYLDQNIHGHQRDMIMAAVIAAWGLSTGICLICATSDLWHRR
jgi:hypothetical protein